MTDPRFDPDHQLHAAAVAGDLSARLWTICNIALRRGSYGPDASAWAEVIRICTHDREPRLQDVDAVSTTPPDSQQTAPRGATFARGSDCDGGVSNDG